MTALRQGLWVGLGIAIAFMQLVLVVTGVVAIWVADGAAHPGASHGFLAIVFEVILCTMCIAVFVTAVLRLARDGQWEHASDTANMLARLELLNRGVRESVYITMGVSALTLFLVLLPNEVAQMETDRALLLVFLGLLYVLFRQQEDANWMSGICREAIKRQDQLAPAGKFR